MCRVFYNHAVWPQGTCRRRPAEIDLKALWDRGRVPIIKSLGFEPVRGDQDTIGPDAVAYSENYSHSSSTKRGARLLRVLQIYLHYSHLISMV